MPELTTKQTEIKPEYAPPRKDVALETKFQTFLKLPSGRKIWAEGSYAEDRALLAEDLFPERYHP